MTTPTDLAAAARRIVALETIPFVHGYDLRAQQADAQTVAREYLRLLPYIQAVRDRRAELVAANDDDSRGLGIDFDAVGAALDWHRLAAFDLAGAVCGEFKD